MSDIIEEIKEDVRLEQTLSFLKTYGNLLIVLILTTVIGISGYAFWQSYQDKQQLQRSALFFQALKASQNQQSLEAQNLFTLLEKDKRDGYRILAAFRRAQLDSTPLEDRKAIYIDISQDKSIEATLRELAVVLWGYESLESETSQFLQSKLQPLIENNSSWASSAQELTALAEIRDGQYKKAAKRFGDLIKDENTSEKIRARAVAFYEHFGLNSD